MKTNTALVSPPESEKEESKKRFHVCGVTCEPHLSECNNYCNMKTICGQKYVGPMPDSPGTYESDSAKHAHTESTPSEESQEELWREVGRNRDFFGDDGFWLRRVQEMFIITRR